MTKHYTQIRINALQLTIDEILSAIKSWERMQQRDVPVWMKNNRRLPRIKHAYPQRLRYIVGAAELPKYMK